MGKIHYPEQVKLITGILTNEAGIFKKIIKILESYFGPIDYKSSPIDFNYTKYYEKELGKGLKRYFLSFRRLIDPKRLANIKITTNKIENIFSLRDKRKINIDPGYINLSKLVLATTKDFNHRIYLNKGIYAEVTLFYQDNTFKDWAWTYPDYKTAEYKDIFNQIRKIYVEQLRCIRHT